MVTRKRRVVRRTASQSPVLPQSPAPDEEAPKRSKGGDETYARMRKGLEHQLHYFPGDVLRACAGCGEGVDPGKGHYHSADGLFHRTCCPRGRQPRGGPVIPAYDRWEASLPPGPVLDDDRCEAVIKAVWQDYVGGTPPEVTSVASDMRMRTVLHVAAHAVLNPTFSGDGKHDRGVHDDPRFVALMCVLMARWGIADGRESVASARRMGLRLGPCPVVINHG